MSRANRIREEASQAEAELLKLASNPDTPPANDTALLADAPPPVAADIPPPPPPAQPRALEQDFEALQHRYNTLQGMFARQGADAAALRQQMERVEQQLAQLKQAAPAAPAAPTTGSVTAKDREEYGAPLIDLIRRGALDAVSIQLQTIIARLDRLERGLTETAATAKTAVKTTEDIAEEKFYTGLTAAHPDWQAVNKSAAWLTWLEETDPMTGMRRDDLLQDAYRSLNVVRTAAFFTMFKRDTGKSDTASGEAKSDAGRVDPRSLVAPSSSASPPPTSTQARPRGKVWTMAEINKTYSDFAKGRIDASKFRELEADIHLAALENRVQ